MRSHAAHALPDRKLGQVRGRASNRGRATPFRLLVLSTDIADTVWAAGGLIFDSVRAGWTVEVYLETSSDDRALKILGVDGLMLPEVFEFDSQWPDAVYVAAALHERHHGVARLVAQSVRRHPTAVAMWGAELGVGAGTEHRLSTAAQAFKRHATHAAGLTSHIAPVEPFRSESRRTR